LTAAFTAAAQSGPFDRWWTLAGQVKDFFGEGMDDDDAIQIASGTWTWKHTIRRRGNLGDSNFNARFTSAIARARHTGGSVDDEANWSIGEVVRQTTAGQTITTSDAGINFSAAGVAAQTMLGGDYIAVITAIQTLVAGSPGGPGQNQAIFSYNEPGGIPARIIAIPDYTVEYGRSVAETAPAADTVDRVLTSARAITENAPAADTVTRRGEFVRATGEAAPADDAIARVFTGARAITESAPATDAVIRSFTGARSITESAPADDALVRVYTAIRATGEAAPADDAIARVFTGARTITELAPAVDAVTRSFIGARTITEGAPAADTVTRRGEFVRVTTEAAPADDALTRIYTAVRETTENAPAADAVTRSFTGARSITEVAPAADTVTRRGEFVRAIAEAAPADAAIARVFTGARAITESAPATDAVTRSFTGARSITELAPAVDAVARQITYGRSIVEGPGDVINFAGFKELTGLVFDPDGAVYEGAEVWLIRLADDRHIQTTFSDVNGIWQFDRDLFDVQSYLMYAFTEIGGVQHADVSDRGISVVDVGTVTPGDPLNGVDANLYLVPQGVGGTPEVGDGPSFILVDGRPVLRLGGPLYTEAD
jgi:hypothetical protein